MMLKNLKINKKLLILIIIAIVTSIVIGAVGMVLLNKLAKQSNDTYNTISRPLGELTEMSNSYGELRTDLRDLALNYDEALNEQYKKDIENSLATFETHIKNYKTILNNYHVTTTEEAKNVDLLMDQLPTLEATVSKGILAGIDNDSVQVTTIIKEEFAPISSTVLTAINTLTELNIDQASDASASAQKSMLLGNVVMIVVFIFGILILILVSMAITKAIVKPINEIVDIATNLAEGNMNVNVRVDSTDEIGILSSKFKQVIDTFKNIIQEMETMSKEHDQGNMDYAIHASKFKGSYKEVTEGVNNMISSYTGTIGEILVCLEGFGNGDFNVSMRELPGKKAEITTSVKHVKENLNDISSNINFLVKKASEGSLSEQVDISKFKGEWKSILTSLNSLMMVIAEPIKECSEVLLSMSKGNLSNKMNGNYKGDFNIIKSSMNKTTEAVSSYIVEIDNVLTEIANNNLNVGITREYVGQFSAIKNAINMIVASLSQVIGDINSAAEQVHTGARQISESSMTLAEGATEQASSVQELNATLDTINEKTQTTAQNAKMANKIAEESMANAQHGNQEMESMLTSMEGIKTASYNISKIIKVIDDIAFQTNLLALNAAVEAARAGEHGKGFAVVAEEVRNLAARSQKAASETTALIDDSVTKVNLGTKIAGETAEALKTIVENVTSVSGIIKEIDQASQDQAYGLSQVGIGLGQIAQVVQANSSTSEESAAASQELSSQSEVLRNMVGVFQMKR